MFTSVTNAYTRINDASPDAAIAYKALGYTVGLISGALQVAAIWFAAWYVGWLIALLISIAGLLLSCAFINAVSEEKFASAGESIGSSIATVRGWFTRN